MTQQIASATFGQPQHRKSSHMTVYRSNVSAECVFSTQNGIVPIILQDIVTLSRKDKSDSLLQNIIILSIRLGMELNLFVI